MCPRRARTARAQLAQRALCAPLPGRHGALRGRKRWLCDGAAAGEPSCPRLRAAAAARRRVRRGGGDGRRRPRSAVGADPARAEHFAVGSCLHRAVQPGMAVVCAAASHTGRAKSHLVDSIHGGIHIIHDAVSLQGVSSGGTVFMAGQIGLDPPTMRLVEGVLQKPFRLGW